LYVADGGAFGVVFLVQGLRKCGFLELGNWGFFEREREGIVWPVLESFVALWPGLLGSRLARVLLP